MRLIFTTLIFSMLTQPVWSDQQDEIFYCVSTNYWGIYDDLLVIPRPEAKFKLAIGHDSIRLSNFALNLPIKKRESRFRFSGGSESHIFMYAGGERSGRITLATVTVETSYLFKASCEKF